MKNYQWIVGAAAGTFLISCQVTPQATVPQSLTLPQALSQLTNLGQSAPTAQNFPRPLIADQTVGTKTAQRARLPLGLIQPTNSQQRTAIVSKGRRDPFALIPLAPIAVATANSDILAAAPQLPPTPVPAGPAAISIPAPPTLPSLGLVPLPPVPEASSTIPPLPTAAIAPRVAPLSRTHLADKIQVAGVIQTRGQLSAIVRSPDEIAGRYVVVGDYLANGKVLVKRIESRPGAEPIVVLEQNGVQVRKSVGGPLASAR